MKRPREENRSVPEQSVRPRRSRPRSASVIIPSHGRPDMLAFGAHTIKNCLGPVLIDLMAQGWLTHLDTNGAGIIHDW